MKTLVLNAGSSSIKYHVYGLNDETVYESGLIEHLNEAHDICHQWWMGDNSAYRQKLAQCDIPAVFEYLIQYLKNRYQISVVAHRVVHGGVKFSRPVLIDKAVLVDIRHTVDLAPLHNPVNICGIEVAIRHLPDTPQVAVFDTAFHHSLPQRSYRFALPEEIVQRHHLRRYGFHGISHQYLMNEVAIQFETTPQSLNIISLHLGNGASIAAIEAGCCIDTSMGMTPTAGLVMGTRCGDLDPGVILHLLRAGYDTDTIDDLLNQQSGLKGMCGSNDMREILQRVENSDEPAQHAVELFCYSIKKYIGAYCAILGRVDALVFSGGIGENAWQIRQQCCEGLEHLGICIDNQRNRNADGGCFRLDNGDYATAIFKIATNEELQMARLARDFLNP